MQHSACIRLTNVSFAVEVSEPDLLKVVSNKICSFLTRNFP